MTDNPGMRQESQKCERCGSETVVVTAVTVRTLGTDPRRVLVTRRCRDAACQFKFPVLKEEKTLEDDERAVWHQP